MVNNQFIYWNQLPSDTKQLVLSYLDQKTLRKTRGASKEIKTLAENILKENEKYDFFRIEYTAKKQAQTIKRVAKIAAPLTMPVLAISVATSAALVVPLSFVGTPMMLAGMATKSKKIYKAGQIIAYAPVLTSVTSMKINIKLIKKGDLGEFKSYKHMFNWVKYKIGSFD